MEKNKNKEFDVKLSLKLEAMYTFTDKGKSIQEVREKWIKNIASSVEKYIDIDIEEIK